MCPTYPAGTFLPEFYKEMSFDLFTSIIIYATCQANLIYFDFITKLVLGQD